MTNYDNDYGVINKQDGVEFYIQLPKEEIQKLKEKRNTIIFCKHRAATKRSVAECDSSNCPNMRLVANGKGIRCNIFIFFLLIIRIMNNK